MKKILYLCVLLAVCAGCRRANPKIVSCEIMPIEAQACDTAMLQLIEPYKQAQQLEMSVVIGESEQLMHASLPEDLLNAFVSDAMFEYANSLKPTDLAITNFGGLRNDLPQGAVTVGHVLQVMPFDNALVFLELPGDAMLRLADAIAAKGGEVQTGLSLTIDRTGKAKNVLLGGRPIDTKRTYRVITTDYLSYGNDHLEPLADYTKMELLQTMLRDMLTDHIRKQTAAGKTLHTNLKNQIHVEK